MRLRSLVSLAVAVLASGVGSARADIAPSPIRPQWDDTPMPMPSDPEELFALILVVAVLALGALVSGALRRRAR